MAYFTRKMDSIERGGKVAADAFCVLILGIMAGGCLGIALGIAVTIVVTVGIYILDHFAADRDDSPAGVVR